MLCRRKHSTRNGALYVSGTLTRDLPITVAQLPVLSQAYYSKQPFEETSLKPPLGSGPYMIKDFKPGTFISYARREDYWAKDLPVNRGRFNFDEIRYDYYRDRNIELEALKSGQIDFREGVSSVSWATGYDIAAVRDGRLIKTSLPDNRPSGAQGFFINTRRDGFQKTRACGRRSIWCSILNGRTSCFTVVQAHDELLRKLRHEGDRVAKSGGTGAARTLQG